ncbi:MAG: hypothetical protein JOZ51_23175 [Chloroflexi bacterium]|nr:hypothetical protein [Chloroflexota bacterium]
MSALFAFNVAKPVEMADFGDAGTYDPQEQVWVGGDRTVAGVVCTSKCGYSGYLRCQISGNVCVQSDTTSTNPYYACIYVGCDVV